MDSMKFHGIHGILCGIHGRCDKICGPCGTSSWFAVFLFLLVTQVSLIFIVFYLVSDDLLGSLRLDLIDLLEFPMIFIEFHGIHRILLEPKHSMNSTEYHGFHGNSMEFYGPLEFVAFLGILAFPRDSMEFTEGIEVRGGHKISRIL